MDLLLRDFTALSAASAAGDPAGDNEVNAAQRRRQESVDLGVKRSRRARFAGSGPAAVTQSAAALTLKHGGNAPANRLPRIFNRSTP